HGSTGTMMDLGDIPSGTNSAGATAINSFDRVVGSSTHAFRWTADEGILDLSGLLDSSGTNWVVTVARGINDSGQIVGIGTFDADGPGGSAPVTHAFLLTPIVPEPSAWLIPSAAFVVSTWHNRRRRP